MAYTILIVDDSSVIRSIMKKSISMARLPINMIHEASNGLEALNVMKNNWIDIVFTDLNMPVMDGFEFVEKLSAVTSSADTPVVVVSSNRDPKQIEALKARGVNAYLTKPFTPEGLREVVIDLLGDFLEASNERK